MTVAGVRAGRAVGGRVLTARGLRTRENLVSAAHRVFERTPFPDARLSDITAEAGVAAGTFYTYFDAKEEIFREVADDVLAELATAGAAIPATLAAIGSATSPTPAVATSRPACATPRSSGRWSSSL